MMNAAANYNPGGRNSGGGSSSLEATIAASKESRQQRLQEHIDRYGYKDCHTLQTIPVLFNIPTTSTGIILIRHRKMLS